jgi:hypothetical protein
MQSHINIIYYNIIQNVYNAPKCSKSHVRASRISKNFPGAMPPHPCSKGRGGEMRGKGRRGRGGEEEGGRGGEEKGREGEESNPPTFTTCLRPCHRVSATNAHNAEFASENVKKNPYIVLSDTARSSSVDRSPVVQSLKCVERLNYTIWYDCLSTRQIR